MKQEVRDLNDTIRQCERDSVAKSYQSQVDTMKSAITKSVYSIDIELENLIESLESPIKDETMLILHKIAANIGIIKGSLL